MRYYTLPKNLSELDHFRSNPMIQFKDENVGGVDVVVPCYMISDSDLWQQPYAMELRGHVFRKDTGELISAALSKFFNLGENSWTQKQNIDFSKIVNVADKKDGSLITFVVIDGKVYAKTKKSFYSDVAIVAQKFLDETYEGELIKTHVLESFEQGYSPVYEFWHPDWKIVLSYGDKPCMMYLGCRDMTSSDWIPSIEQLYSAQSEEIFADIEKWQAETVGVEGVVVQLDDGRLIKIKTLDYLRKHHVKTDLRERDLVQLAALEQLDDVKSVIVESGMDLSTVEAIETEVAEKIASIRKIVEECALNSDLKDAKTTALYYKNHEYFGLIMRKYRGQEPDYVEYFLKNHLKDYSLRCCYNPNF